MKQRWNALPAKQRRRIKWTLSLLLAYAIIGFLILPPIVRSVARKQLAAELNRPVTIEKVRLNPFTFSATVRGLLIQDRDGEPFVSWDEVHVNLQLRSFLGRAWILKEVSATRPYVRAQMNKDYTFNFSDLIEKYSTNAPSGKPSKPLALRVGQVRITGASASLTDLTPRTPFKRVLGPLDVTLLKFRTDPENRNPYSFSGTTDAGEQFSWSGHFYLDPLRSEGELTLGNLAVNKYSPLYQDLVRFEIRDGIVSLRSAYRFELSATNRVAAISNAAVTLDSFRVADPDLDLDLIHLPRFSVSGAHIDAIARTAEIQSVSSSGARLHLKRDAAHGINVVELARPADTATNAPGGVLFLLHSVTNAIAMLLDSTNAWSGTVHGIEISDAAVLLEDLANERPVHLQLDQIAFSARDLSNLPGRTLTSSLALRWNTNGIIKAGVIAGLAPPEADINLELTDLELKPLDPYLDQQLNVFITGSKLGLDGRITLRDKQPDLPEIRFAGNVRLNDFASVDGLLGEDLLSWESVRVSGINAQLNPPVVAIDEIAIDNAAARVVVETNRTINLLAALRMESQSAAETSETNASAPSAGERAAAPAPASSTPAAHKASLPVERLTISNVVISNAAIRFTDRSLTPNVNMTIERVGGIISGLSSDELQRGDVRLQASVDNVGPVEIVGRINPFTDNQTNELSIVVSDVDLTPAGPYSGRFAGYGIARGKLSMKLDYLVRGRAVQSENVITLDQFTFGERVESPEATKLPVRLAVAILKDRQGRIVLDVPVRGSLDDPEFKIGRVVVRALGNVITKIATSPFAALGALFGGAGEEISYQDFDAGSAELQPDAAAKLDVLSKGMYERPGLQLDIIGSVDPVADRRGLQRELLEKQLRTLKWQGLRRGDRASTTPDQLTIAPEERAELVKRLYADAVAAGTIKLDPAPGDSAASSATPRPAAVRSATQERGAMALLQAADLPLPASAQSADAATADISDPYERVLADSIEVEESEFLSLAAERARVVRQHLMERGNVASERLFISSGTSAPSRKDGPRVYLQFR